MSTTTVFAFGEQTRTNPIQLGNYATRHVIDHPRVVEATVVNRLTAGKTATQTGINVTSSSTTPLTTDLNGHRVLVPPALADDSRCIDPHTARAQQACQEAIPPLMPNLPPRLRKVRPGRRERALLRLQRQGGICHDPAACRQDPAAGHDTVDARMGATNVLSPPENKAPDDDPSPTPGDMPPRLRAKPGRRERALRRLQREAAILQDPATSQQVEATGPKPGPDATLPPPPTTTVDASSPVMEMEKGVEGTECVQLSHVRQPAELVSAQGRANGIQSSAASQHDHPSISPPPYDPIALGLEAAQFILQQHGSTQYPAAAAAHDQPQYPVAAEQHQFVDWAIERQHAASGEGGSMAVRLDYAEGGSFSRMAILTDWSPHYWQPRPFASSLPPNAVSQEAAAVPLRVLQNSGYGAGEPEAPYAYSSPWPVPTGHQAPETMVPAPYEAPASTALPQGGAFPPEPAEAPDAPDLTQFPAAPEPCSLALTQAIYPFVECPGPCPANCPRRLMLSRAYSRRPHARYGMSRLPCPIRFDPFDEDLDSEGREPPFPLAGLDYPTSPISPATATTASVSTPRGAAFNAGISPCSSCKGLTLTGEEVIYSTCCGIRSPAAHAGDSEAEVTLGIPVRRERRQAPLADGEHPSTPWWYRDQREAHRYLELLEYLEHRAILRVKAKLDNLEESDRPPLMPLWIHFPQLLPPVFDAPPENMLQLQLSGN
ncbi:hypothetical protein GLOTRDRAFT_129383 [Gloeophyllum trabeum ATCC 11539]|uniref:Uncharacterized protein n=1 Tax=Gloeophyllum trabeum (strain ATCC 11539 / FP-39264 / Madison 617) TaxID=670483 RepID=S7Q6F5_GLOTA|nr:uncharacterized protein GLOTRDRAFT_129383 [Gloeophyllum trabeum ATCC 11539]EPQ55092.1 hypothetical protein GLOTRDRAFT_129383 [Gloeophyllum trabeum ATCC 11539]